jgi:hypothetical protein
MLRISSLSLEEGTHVSWPIGPYCRPSVFSWINPGGSGQCSCSSEPGEGIHQTHETNKCRLPGKSFGQQVTIGRREKRLKCSSDDFVLSFPTKPLRSCAIQY